MFLLTLIYTSTCLLFIYKTRTLYMGNEQEDMINQKDKMRKPGYDVVKVYKQRL